MNLNVKEFESLAEHTTFKIGGAARFFVEAESEAEVVRAVDFAREKSLKIFILGGGSNVLIADVGFDGLVIKIALKRLDFIFRENETALVTAGAGEDWDELVAICTGKNLQGFECLSGIPGLVGGTPVQNVGAYGQDVSETIVSVKVFDRSSNQIFEMPAEECKFSYRTSIFNTTEKNRFIVLAVTFKLKQNGQPKIVYKDLQQFFGQTKPTLKEVRDAVLNIRRAKSMVIDYSDPNSKSAGSFFKNPIVKFERFKAISEKCGGLIPNYAVDDNSVKIPAAWLIEHSGFARGFRRGSVGISTRHSLAIVNLENATASEVLDFMSEIQNNVEKKFEITLQPEPVFVGFE